jgi:hypothetical protein
VTINLERPASLKRDVKLLLVVRSVIMLRVVLPNWGHPACIHAELGKAETLASKEKLLPLLKGAGVTLHLVASVDCDVWHNRFW